MKRDNFNDAINNMIKDARKIKDSYQIFDQDTKAKYEKVIARKIDEAQDLKKDSGRVNKLDIENLNALQTAFQCLYNFLKLFAEKHYKEIHGDKIEEVGPERFNLTGSKTVRRIRAHERLAYNHSKSTFSEYELFKVGQNLIQIRTSDHMNQRGNISVTKLNLGDPITNGTPILEERYGRTGKVIKSNEFVTDIEFNDGQVETYNTSYANGRICFM